MVVVMAVVVVMVVRSAEVRAKNTEHRAQSRE
jgi:hypothetical protein